MKPNKIYIDLGCFDGDSILKFYGHHIPKNWQVFGFDPNPRYLKIWQAIVETYPFCIFDTGIAWIEDTIMPFTVRPENSPYGSTAIQDKVDWGNGEIIETHAFNFSEWLKQFKGYEEVIVKFDIEGSEFAVLEKMIEDRTIYIPTMIYIEWHHSKMGGRSTEYDKRRLNIIDYMNNNNITWDKWTDQ